MGLLGKGLLHTRSSLSRFDARLRDAAVNRNQSIRFYKWWTRENLEREWFYRLCLAHDITDVSFLSVFRYYEDISWIKGKRVFFSGENLNENFTKYRNYLDGAVSLALGLDYEDNVKHNHYLRFPLWMKYFLIPDGEVGDSREMSVSDFISRLNAPVSYNPALAQCALVASHDDFGNLRGTRTKALRELSFLKIDCGGRFNNNTDRLKAECHDDLDFFLNGYKYNICIENSDSRGYVTEKLFTAIMNQCVPIYWGSQGLPEPEVLNGNGIILFDPRNPSAALKELKRLEKSKDYFEEFTSRQKTTNWAQEWIEERHGLLVKALNSG